MARSGDCRRCEDAWAKEALRDLEVLIGSGVSVRVRHLRDGRGFWTGEVEGVGDCVGTSCRVVGGSASEVLRLLVAARLQ